MTNGYSADDVKSMVVAASSDQKAGTISVCPFCQRELKATGKCAPCRFKPGGKGTVNNFVPKYNTSMPIQVVRYVHGFK